MNVRSVTRGDAAVALLALLLLIASFLPFVQADNCRPGGVCSLNAWHAAYFPVLPSVFLAGLIGGALLVLARFVPRELRVAGLQVGQWGTALTVFAAWSALWAVFSDDGSEVSHGVGAWLGLLFSLLLAGTALAGAAVPALNAPLVPEQRTQTPQQFHGASAASAYGSPQQPGGYGYPAGAPGRTAPDAAQPGQPQPAYAGAQPQDDQPQPAGPAQEAAAHPQQSQQPKAAAPAPQSSAPFAPFWFAVPAVRRLAPEHDPAGPPVGELTPGVWYLAVDERNGALVAQTQDGKRGVLTDTSGIQRG